MYCCAVSERLRCVETNLDIWIHGTDLYGITAGASMYYNKSIYIYIGILYKLQMRVYTDIGVHFVCARTLAA